MPEFSGLSYSEKRKCLLNGADVEVKLRPKSLAVFQYLSQRPDTVVTRQAISDAVWKGTIVTDDSLVKCISDIRRALEDSDQRVLRTIPRQGYMLVSDSPATSVPLSSISQTNPRPLIDQLKPWRWVAVLMISGGAGLYWQHTAQEPMQPASVKADETKPIKIETTKYSSVTHMETETDSDEDIPPSIELVLPQTENSTYNEEYGLFATELRESLSQYRNIRVVENDNSDYQLRLLKHRMATGNSQLNLELIHNPSDTLLFAERFDDVSPATIADVSALAAGLLLSPSGGAIGRHLMALSRDKPAADLTRAECIAHGYDCTNCSGELDSVTQKAEACLERYLKEDPNDPQLWALQSTVQSHQYTFGSTLDEPLRTDITARSHLVGKAIQSATRSEKLSNGDDSSVYWGMAQAYSASCEVDKLRAAAKRGLEINPHDPGLLAAFGNWIAYTGHWDEGVALVENALEQSPRVYKKWWLFGVAKRHYSRGEYQEAYDVFVRAFNERNWLSHLQLAYTLPYLDRLDEAKTAIEKLQETAPGLTLERVLEFYKSYCFPDSFLAKMKLALTMAGMPSRGNSDDFTAIQAPRAKILTLGDYKAEYMDLGEGVPVVFVHGAISDYRTWAFFQNLVSEDYRYISYSRRYFGSQPWPDQGEKYSFDVAAEDLIALIEALDLEKVFLVSWSSGGPIANLAAAARPDLFHGLIHYEPVDFDIFTEKESEQYSASMEELFNGFDRADEYLERGQLEMSVKVVLETVFQLEPGGFENEIMALRRVLLDSARNRLLHQKPATGNTCEFLHDIKLPTLVVRGANTNLGWFEMAAKFSRCMPNAELTTLPGVNHDGPIRDHRAFYAEIDRFIQKLL